MSDVSSAPVGWYPTPEGPQRWWDGSAWSPPPVPPAPGSKKRLLIIVIASVAVVLALIVTGTVIAMNFISNTEKAAALCQRVADDPALISDLTSLVQPLNDVSSPSVPGSDPRQAERLAIANQIADLNSRLDRILTSSGGAYPEVWDTGTDIYIYLDDVGRALQPEVAPGSLSIDAGSPLGSDVEVLADQLAQQCGTR